MQTMQPAWNKGADRIAEALMALDVRTIFCYPGGANLEILDALSRTAIELIRTEHEQGAIFAAQGYARASGRLGVCLATSGPGATNLVTGIADANSDSVPVLALTGNVSTRWLGKNAFQEVDIVSIVKPVTKLSIQVRDCNEIASTLGRAADTALSGRPGPVLVDFPKDIQQAIVKADAHEMGVPAKSTVAMTTPSAVSSDIWRGVADLLKRSSKPVIYAGGGIIASNTGSALIQLAERLECPVTLTLMGLGSVDAHHPLWLGPLGMHGCQAANVAVNEADLVLALGVRFDDRVIGDPAAFAACAKIVHIDIDHREVGKNKRVDIAIVADLHEALPKLLAIAHQMPTAEWRKYLAAVDRGRPLSAYAEANGRITGPHVISTLSLQLPENAIVTTGVGQHQMWTMQHLRPRRPRGFLTSGGFGSMGFGLPAAIGAKRACPHATVVDIDGDGSLNMTINELSTCRRYNLGVKILVINNQWLGMVRQWQDFIYQGNRVISQLDDSKPANTASIYPDFMAIASGYRIASDRVVALHELNAGLQRLLSDPQEPFLLDVIVERESDVLPMIPAGMTYRDVIFDHSGMPRVSDT